MGHGNGFIGEWSGKSITVLIVIACTMLFGFSQAIVGSIFIDYCKLQPLIPKYLIVSGLIPIVTGILSFLLYRHFSESNGIIMGVFCVIAVIFNVIWRICGSVWVYPMFDKLIVNAPPRPPDVTTTTHMYHVEDDCHLPLLGFSFAAVTIDWLILVMVLIVVVYKGVNIYRLQIKAACTNCHVSDTISSIESRV